MRVLPTLVEDLLEVVGRPYDGIDHVVMDDVHETMLDPGKCDHPLAALGVVARALIFLDREPVHARTGGELLQRPAKQTAGGLKLDASDPNCEHDRKIRSPS